jgi:ubiquinone biosynthesis monooxygenase Coq7
MTAPTSPSRVAVIASGGAVVEGAGHSAGALAAVKLESATFGPDTTQDLTRLPSPTLPAAVVADLRTDQAGEVGAVRIYQGVLAVTRDPALRAFALRHLATERSHLQRIEAWLPRAHHSRLLPLWQAAGWITGAMPALLGPRAVYCTIEAVERFVDLHYAQQIEHLASHPELALLRRTLIDCQGDELAHRIEAAAARGAAPGALMRIWVWLVGTGSRGAVAICRHI